jgi:hypothetical protein
MKEQAEAVRSMGMEQYLQFKARIFKFTAVLVAVGMAVSAAVGGADAAEAFMLGGAVAFFYQLVLNQSVDCILADVPQISVEANSPDVLGLQALGLAGEGGLMRNVLHGSAMRRLLMAVAFMIAVICGAHAWDSALLHSSAYAADTAA